MNKHFGAKHSVMVHDAHGLKNFWEEIIQSHAKQKQVEETRLNRSALNKLRHEWAQRLEGRIKMLQKTGEMSKMQTSLSPIESFQSIHRTAA